MRRSGESWNNLEATQLTAILSTMATLKIGTWNMMIRYAAEKSGQVTNEMRNNGLSSLGISEARYIGSGQQRLATGELLLYSGREKENAPHTHNG